MKDYDYKVHKTAEFAMAGAGSVITKDIAPIALVYGNPAMQRRWVCECVSKLEKLQRRFCSINYTEFKGLLVN